MNTSRVFGTLGRLFFFVRVPEAYSFVLHGANDSFPSLSLSVFFLKIDDITLAIANRKTDDKWLDRFVKMKEKWIKDAKGWGEYFDAKYPVCGKLDKWANEDPDSWPELEGEELEAYEKGCTIM